MKRMKFYFFCLMAMFTFTRAFAEDTINIAAIYSLTGEAAESNVPSLHGVRFGVEDVNRQGGVLGKKINLLTFDNLSSPIGSAIAAEKAAEADVVCIIGASWSTHSLAVARVAQARRIPMISNISTHPDVTKIGDHIFRVCFTDDFQGGVMARFARQDMNAATAVVFTNLTSDYSLKLSEIFRKNFEQSGGRILLELEYKSKQKRFDEQIIRAKNAGADVLFLSGYDESGFIIRQAQDAGISSVPLGGDGWSIQGFFSKGGSELRRGYHCTHWSEFADSEISRSFVKKYKHFDKLNASTVLGYDAVMVLADAIRRAGSADRAKIREALANTRSFEGVTGTITFDANGDPVKSAVIMEIRNGTPRYFKTLKP
ncbi:ABC transporter substrate-binding protein [Desulfobacterales bacterium HSG2]|nr:ABC transporter substrate-binding protein [Desulfobacterales bacterium HSG2]